MSTGSRFSWLKPQPAQFLTPSVLTLILANLVPLYGLFFLHWVVFPVLLLFWIENVIIGVFNVFRMLLASPSKPLDWVGKLFMIPFFCFHYGMFTFVHGVFVFGFFGRYFTSGAPFPDIHTLTQALRDYQLGWPVLALLLSHAASFTMNYIGNGEYKQAALKDLMAQPYSRVVILHLTIILGAFVVAALGSPVFALLVLIMLKMFIDIQAHLREHKKYSVKKQTDTRPAT
jgi:hypothetical protein